MRVRRGGEGSVDSAKNVLTQKNVLAQKIELSPLCIYERCQKTTVEIVVLVTCLKLINVFIELFYFVAPQYFPLFFSAMCSELFARLKISFFSFSSFYNLQDLKLRQLRFLFF